MAVGSAHPQKAVCGVRCSVYMTLLVPLPIQLAILYIVSTLDKQTKHIYIENLSLLSSGNIVLTVVTEYLPPPLQKNRIVLTRVRQPAPKSYAL